MLLWLSESFISIFHPFLLRVLSLTLLSLRVDVEVVELEALLKQLPRRFNTSSLTFLQFLQLSHRSSFFKHADSLPVVSLVTIIKPLL